MRRAGVLVASVLLAVLTGCEPGGGEDTAAPTTSAAPDLEAHTTVLELVRAADEAAKERGTVAFGLDGGRPPGKHRKPGTQNQGQPGKPPQGQQGGQPQPGGQGQQPQPGGVSAAPQPGGTQPKPGGTQPTSGNNQPKPGGTQPKPGGNQPTSGAAAPSKPLPLAAGRLAYGEKGINVLVRTLQRKQNFEFRTIGESVFTQPTGALVPIAKGMPWLKLDATPTSPLAQLLGPALVDAPNVVDPTRTFDLLVAAGTIVSSERATLGGQDVTRYDVDLDVEELAEHIRLSSADQPRPLIVAALRTLAEQGTTTAPVTVFLDRHNLPRRIKLVNLAALPKLNAPDGLDASSGPGAPNNPDATDLPMLTVNYRDWGKPPTVAAPAAGTVATVPG